MATSKGSERMQDRWGRLASLTGVLFGVVTIAAIVSGGETPDANASSAKVIAYYGTHRSEVETSSILFAFAFLFVVLWAASLRSYLRRTSSAEGLGALVLAGGVLMAAGALLGAGVEYGLAHQLRHLGPEAAQTVNFLSQELFLPILAGAFVFAIASGLAILRGAQLPNWLGWVVIVTGIAALVPPASFPALFVFVIWSIIVSVLMYTRTGAAEPASIGAEPRVGAEPVS
jgi:hypothetical protein